MVDECLAAPARTAASFIGAYQRRGLAESAPELIATIHMAVEVAKDREGDAF
jgi:hypothetical protein